MALKVGFTLLGLSILVGMPSSIFGAAHIEEAAWVIFWAGWCCVILGGLRELWKF